VSEAADLFPLTVSMRVREVLPDRWVISILLNGKARSMGQLHGSREAAVFMVASALQKMAFDLLEAERERLGIELTPYPDPGAG
jgi:hypothetical protein